MAAELGAAGALLGLVAGAVALDPGTAEAVADVVTIDRGWLTVGVGLVATLVSAPWIVTLIQRRENRKLALANAGKADSEASDSRASADLKRQQVVDSLFASLERRIDDLEAQTSHQRVTIQGLQAQRAADDVALMSHGAWDFIAIDQARGHGYDLPPCPPLRGSIAV